MVTVNGGLDFFSSVKADSVPLGDSVVLEAPSPFKEFEIGLRKRGGGKHRN